MEFQFERTSKSAWTTFWTSYKFDCPRCGESLRLQQKDVNRQYLGHTIHCPACGVQLDACKIAEHWDANDDN